VLVVTADVGIQAVLGIALGPFFRVTNAATIRAAFPAMAESRPDAALLGLRPHDPDGLAFIRALRAAQPEVQVVALISDEDASLVSQIAPYRLDGICRTGDVNAVTECLTRLIAVRHQIRIPARRFSQHVNGVFEYVGRHYAEALPVSQIADAVGMSATRLVHVFRPETGMTVRGYVSRVQMDVAKHFLAHTDLKHEAIAQETGCCDGAHFSRRFARSTGIGPKEYRRRFLANVSDAMTTDTQSLKRRSDSREGSDEGVRARAAHPDNPATRMSKKSTARSLARVGDRAHAPRTVNGK
jgi:AraC-like DNA-binding protein